MPTLRADENRYLVHADAAEGALIRRIPGGRWSAPNRVWQFPRQRGVVLALDRVFGREGWTPDEAIAPDIAEARRQMDGPQGAARVELENGQLAIECGFADRELVKLVPGYRWSPPEKRWYVAAAPLALEILEAHFGASLTVSVEARAFIELKAVDERHAGERAEHASAPAGPAAVPLEHGVLQFPPRDTPPDDDPMSGAAFARRRQDSMEAAREAMGGGAGIDEVIARLGRLEAQIDAIAGKLELLTPAAAPLPAWPPPLTATNPSGPGPDDLDWRLILRLSEDDPAAAVDQANRLLQTMEPGESRELEAVAGIANFRAKRLDPAFEHLSGALERGAELSSVDLTELARDAYRDVALAMLNADTNPEEPIDDMARLRQLILLELEKDGGFDDVALGSAAVQGMLERLMTDRALRTTWPRLSDLCRVMHLLSLGKAGARMAGTRALSVLKEEGLSAEVFALVAILNANLMFREESISDWIWRWPLEADESTSAGGATRLADAALDALPLVDRDLAAAAAISVLAALTSEPTSQLGMKERRKLLEFVPKHEGGRKYAEFLAVFRVAAEGERAPWKDYPGYIDTLARTPLSRSASHLTDLYMLKTGVDSAARPLADEAFLPALTTFGITDPVRQLLDLLPLLSEASTPDRLLNELAEMVEDATFTGAEMLDRAQRRQVYRAAFDAAKRLGHDKDSREAFNRLVRSLREDADQQPLRELCAECLSSIKALHVPALVVQLELLLDDRADASQAMDALAAAIRQQPGDRDESENQLLGLQYAYPAFGELVAESVKERGVEPESEPPPSFPGRSVVVFGGREYLRKRADPVLRAWQLKVEWLDPESARNGPKAKALAEGAADLLVVNTACIGHAASGRCIQAAGADGPHLLKQPSNGVGAMLVAIKQRLMELGESPVPAPKPSKVQGLKQKTYGARPAAKR
ncbi:MAG: hypothetical protein HYX53_16005 [Chloroflexi bacterium]|nr:hypothetical protein [Chloroflexota bacterium]